MKKYGIGTGIFAIIFGLITFLCIRIFFGLQNADVDSLGVFVAFLAIALIMMIISAIVGLISGGLTLLFGIITITRIIKAISAPKAQSAQHSSESEPTL